LREHYSFVTFTAQGVDSDEVKRILLENRINVTVSPEEISRLDLSERNLPSVVRASVHYYNTEEEIEEFCNRLKSLYAVAIKSHSHLDDTHID